MQDDGREGVMRLTRRRSVPPAFMLGGLLSLEDIPAVGSWGLRTEWLQLLVNGGLFEDYEFPSQAEEVWICERGKWWAGSDVLREDGIKRDGGTPPPCSELRSVSLFL